MALVYFSLDLLKRIVYRFFRSAALFVGLAACNGSTDTDNETDTDLGTEVKGDFTEAYAFCAAGGSVSDGNISGVTCLSPLDVVASPATDGTLTWTPGPTGKTYK